MRFTNALALVLVIACSGKHDGQTRVFLLEVVTNLGRRLSGGQYTSSCTVWAGHAPHSVITGFYGRSGAELDLIGPIYETQDAVCLFEHVNYSGSSWCYGPGYSAGLSTGNDMASSALVFGNVQMQAFDHYYYTGAAQLIARDIPDFRPSGFNDVLSSFRSCTTSTCY